MRYLFRGLIRETGKTVEGAVEADTPEDALSALSANGIVTEDLTPAPLPITAFTPSARADFMPRTAGGAGAPPVPPGEEGAAEGRPAGGGATGGAPGAAATRGAAAGTGGFVPAQSIVHPGLQSNDPVERAFAAASQAVSFDAVAQRYKGKSVWVIDRDRIRRQVASVVDQALKQAEQEKKNYDGDQVRESVASALKEMFKDNRNIASQQTPEQARAAQAQQNGAAGGAGGGQVVSSPRLEAQIDRMEAFLAKAETVLTQLQVAAKRVGTGGGAAGFAPRRMSHIPKPGNEEQNSVLLEIFKSNVKLRENLAKSKEAGGVELASDPDSEAAGKGASEAGSATESPAAART